MGFHTVSRILPWVMCPSAKSVLLVLAFRANDETGQCDPSIIRLAKETCLGRRTVIRMVAELERIGAIEASHRDGVRTAYTICDRCHHDTGATLALVPTTAKPVPTTTETGATVAPKYIEQREQSMPDPSEEPGIGDAESVGPIFPTKQGAGWQLSRGMLATMTEAYPAIDIGAELAKAACWCAANPARRKTGRGMTAFLNNWLSNAKPAASADHGLVFADRPVTADEARAALGLPGVEHV